MYLKEIIQVLLLLRACFYDFHLISVFFPLIHESLGEAGAVNLFGKIIDSSKLFMSTNQSGDNTTVIDKDVSFGKFAIKSIKTKPDETKFTNHQSRIVQAIQDLGMFKNALYHIFDEVNKNNTDNKGSMNPLDIVIHLENDLDSRINAIQTQTQIKQSDVLLHALPTYDYLEGIEHKG